MLSKPKSSKNHLAPTLPPSVPPSTSPPPPNKITGLLECCNFLSYNYYSEKTIGILAFITRKLVGEINFSDVIDEADRRSQQGRPIDLSTLLRSKRADLPEIEASVEKCLMLTRLISYIEKNKDRFNKIISDIRLDMKAKLTDGKIDQTVQYPDDFRRREKDFVKRQKAQQIRRIFFLNDKDANEPPSLLHLQNKTTAHLSYLIDSKMRYDSQFRDVGIKELERIFMNSFMITTHPHGGVNPVIIYERKEPGKYIAKVSVVIVSFLHDFMQTHPNLIQLDDIEPSIWPVSPFYKLKEPQSITWKTCCLQACPDDKPRMIHYAELSCIVIQQTPKSVAGVHFAQKLHTLKFIIKLRLNLSEYRFANTYHVPLETLPFSIGNHNCQIPRLLTRVILADIRRISRSESIDSKTVSSLMHRYFVHRTGVELNECAKNYLEEELKNATVQRRNFQTLEDIFMDFLVPYVHQVEFMAKHPILAMFHADGLLLGICNSERVAEILKKSADVNASIIGLRFNAIRINYNDIEKSSTTNRAIKISPCAIRVDVYNNCTNRAQNRTFDSTTLVIDISNFVSTISKENRNDISILSSFDDKTSRESIKPCSEFNEYYDKHLHVIYKMNEKYKLITNIIANVEEEEEDRNKEKVSDNEMQDTESSDQFISNSHSTASSSSTSFDFKQTSDATRVQDCMPMTYDCSNENEASSQNILPPSQLNNQEIIQYILSQPQLLTDLFNHLNIANLTPPTVSPRQPSSQILYQNQQPQYACQQQSPSAMFQQVQARPTYQQPAFPSVNSYQPNNVNQEFQFFPQNRVNSTSQQRSTQIQILGISDDNITQLASDSLQLMNTDEIPLMSLNQDPQLYFNELTINTSTSQNDQQIRRGNSISKSTEDDCCYLFNQ